MTPGTDVPAPPANTNCDTRRMLESGVVSLSGTPAAAVLCPVPLATAADELLESFRALCPGSVLPGHSGATLLTERAAITGSQPQGSTSHNAYCRLLPSADGMLGVNLPRDSDWELLPAWLEAGEVSDWEQLSEKLVQRDSRPLVERARLLGLAIVDATHIPRGRTDWQLTRRHGASLARRGDRGPRVVDLSSLWAGPLCTHLWQAAGATVTKVESSQRPDGAREGSAAFFELLNGSKTQLQLELHTDAGRRALRDLIRNADIVVEASRPRALRQMGLVAEDILAEQPGLVWLSITGYGRGEPGENWIAYGDDAAIAAGLSAVTRQATGEWTVIGDAIADPLTGLQAAIAGWRAWLAGGGALVDMALERTVRHIVTSTAPEDGDYRKRHKDWSKVARQTGLLPAPPQKRC